MSIWEALEEVGSFLPHSGEVMLGFITQISRCLKEAKTEASTMTPSCNSSYPRGWSRRSQTQTPGGETTQSRKQTELRVFAPEYLPGRLRDGGLDSRACITRHKGVQSGYFSMFTSNMGDQGQDLCAFICKDSVLGYDARIHTYVHTWMHTCTHACSLRLCTF